MKSMKLFTLILSLFCVFQLSGQTQNGIGLDGVDDYLDCGTDASLDITGPITIEAWIYLNGTLVNYDRIVEKDWATSYFLGGKFGNNGLAFGMDPNGSTANIVESSSGILTNYRWIHVAGTWDGATLKIYMNGDEVGSKAWVNNSVDGSANSTKIGKFYGPEDRFFDGYMDEVRIWNVARTPTELRENMYKELDNPASETNLVAYYRFNEGSGQTSEDLSSNSNTAVFGGTLAVESTDPSWGPSTCPLPYYSVTNGNWNTNSTWATGQSAPTKDWARAIIKHNVTANSDETSLEVTVSPVGALTVANGFNFNVSGDFTVQSNAAGTGSYINYGTDAFGNATMERYYTGGEWHFISPPTSDATAGMFTGLYLQNYTESTNAYTDIIAISTPLIPMQGYALFNASSDVAMFNGTFNDGAVGSSNNLSRSGAGYINYGWNLVGNPYPSSINWDAASGWTKTNVDNATYVHVNASTWATYIGGVGTNGGTSFIAPGQGFFVSVTDNAGTYPEFGTLTMDDNVRAHNNSTFFKSDVSNMVRLEISGNDYTDETVIRFTDDATALFDGDWDAHKLFGYQNEAPQIYSHSNMDYSINAIPEAQPIQIGVRSIESSLFTISATEILDQEYLFLEDLLTGEVTDLMTNGYTFNYEPDVMDHRFILHFSPLTGINPNEMEHMSVIGLNNSIRLILPENTNGQVMIYTITGQLISNVNAGGGNLQVDLLKAGTYIVKVITENWVETKKVSVN